MDLTVLPEYSGIRIDSYISDTIKSCDGESISLSRSRVQSLMEEGAILVGGRKEKPSYKVKADDVITIELPAPKEVDIIPENIPLDILFEDDDILVVNKPKGMVVHPGAGHYNNTLVNAVLYHCKGNLSGINGELRPGIVHRIDMNTTGSLIICKNDSAHNSIAAQLKDHSITREYDAIVYGSFKDSSGTVDAPVGRDPKDRKKMSLRSKNPKRAVTHYRVIKEFKGCTYIKCRLETGRTHQIRVHMTSIGHPLLGDEVYKNSGNSLKLPFKLTGQTLHAGLIGFKHPSTGEYMEFRAPLPEYFNKLITCLQ